MVRRFSILAAVLLCSLLLPSALLANTVYTFDDLSSSVIGTPFPYTEDGLTANFTSPSDFAPFLNGFAIADASAFGFTTLSGNVLLTNVPDSELDVAFSSDINAISLLFGFGGFSTDTITLTAFENGTEVGSATADPSLGSLFPEGSLLFDGGGASFNSISLTSTAGYFAVDNVTIVPEPASLFLLGSGILAVAGKLRRGLKR